MNIKKSKITIVPLFGFRMMPDKEASTFDPTGYTVITITHLVGDRK